jgi:hypothetical protein
VAREQRAFVLVQMVGSNFPIEEADTTSLEALNELLREGWTVRYSSPMGGAAFAGHDTSRRGMCWASLVILER